MLCVQCWARPASGEAANRCYKNDASRLLNDLRIADVSG